MVNLADGASILFPAYAGVILLVLPEVDRLFSFPRIRGAYPKNHRLNGKRNDISGKEKPYNFITRAGCHQEPRKVLREHLKKVPIKANEPPRFP